MSGSIIKITEAMRQAVQLIQYGDDADNVLMSMIKMIERNYIVQPRCEERLGDDMRCCLVAGHGGVMHPVILPNGMRIEFQNLVDNSTGEE